MACGVSPRFPLPAPTAEGGSSVGATHCALAVGGEGTCELAVLETNPAELEEATLSVTWSKGAYPSGGTGGATPREAWWVSNCSFIREGGLPASKSDVVSEGNVIYGRRAPAISVTGSGLK